MEHNASGKGDCRSEVVLEGGALGTRIGLLR
jgi:hypothetical protein